MGVLHLSNVNSIIDKTGGNIQEILKLAQMGLITPLDATVAAQKIKDIRAAAQAEAVPQQTVAQQLFAPPQPPQMPPQGGAPMPPQGGAPMPPQAPPPQMPPQGPGPGMAAGGITSLPVPDSMFDEPSNGGFNDGGASYAPGGLVAFAQGDRISDEAFVNYIRNRESRGRDFDAKGQPLTSSKGALFGMQVMPATAHNPGYGVAPAKSETAEEYNRVGHDLALAFRNKYGNDRDALAAYNMGPGRTDKWIAAGRPDSGLPAETRNYLSAGAPAGLGATAPAQAAAPQGAPQTSATADDLMAQFAPAQQQGMALYDQQIAPKHEAADKLTEYAKKYGSDEELAKQKDYDKWSMLAEFGFKLAGSNSPYFLQAVGDAASAALPGAREAKKAREARKLESIKMLADAENITNQQAEKRVNFGLEYAKTKLGLKNSTLDRIAAEQRTRITANAGIQEANIHAGATRYAADQGRIGQMGYADKLALMEETKLKQALAAIPEQATKNIDDKLLSDNAYNELGSKYKGAELAAQQRAYRRNKINDETQRLMQQLTGLMGSAGVNQGGSNNGPPVGTVYKGRTFMGGDPNDKSNWK